MTSLTGEATAGTLDSAEDIGTKPREIVAYWLSQEKLAEREMADWRKRGRKVVKRYRDERQSQATRSGSKFNVLWANIQVMKPVLYARKPVPDIAPRWIDTTEEVVRVAATILERSLNYISDRHDIDSVVASVVEDRLLPGAGFARIRYEPTFGDEVADPTNAGQTFQPVESEIVRWTYEHWEDVAWSPCRRWEEATWLRFKSYMTRDELVKRFGQKIGKAVPLDYTPRGMEKEDIRPDLFKKATVLEFWDKGNKKVCWIAKEYPDEPLDEIKDPLELDDFWPCPKPLFATTASDKLIPVPDFAQYQDQAEQLDVIAARIDKLTRALRVAGVYAASEKASLQTLLSDDSDNRLIPVEDWAQFAGQKGGLEGAIMWLPIKTIVDVLEKLYQAFDRQKQSLYEISGLSDIMRGSTHPDETAAAQKLKSQYGTIRTQNSQKDVARFSRDLFRLAGQVIARHLDPKTISQMTGLPELPPPVPQPQPPMLALPGMAASAPGMPPPGGPAQQAPSAPQMAPPQAPAAPPAPAAGALPSPPAQPTAQGPQAAAGDPLAQFQKDMAAYQAYVQEVQQKTQEFASACQILKQDALRTFRLDVEADSTIAPDEEAEKKARVEFVTAVGSLLKESAPMVQQMPQAGGALVAEILKFMTHGFRAGRPLEETIDKFADYLDKLPPPQTHTDPALIKVQAESQAEQARLQAETQMNTAKLQAAQQQEAAELQALNQREMVKQQAEDAREHIRMQAEDQRERLRLQTDRDLAQQKIASDRDLAHSKMQGELALRKYEISSEVAKAHVVSQAKTKIADGQNAVKERIAIAKPKKDAANDTKPAESNVVPLNGPAKLRRFAMKRDPKTGDLLGIDEMPPQEAKE